MRLCLSDFEITPIGRHSGALMNRSRRVAATVVAATGILGAAGAAAATVGGLTGSKVAQNDKPAAVSEPDAAAAVSSSEQTDGRTVLEDYVDSMAHRGDQLGERVSAAENRLAAAKATRARLIEIVRARTAALRARVTAEEAAAPVARQQHSSAPSTHTSTGASSGGEGDDDGGGHHGDDGGGGDD
jgi:hypothetical protein